MAASGDGEVRTRLDKWLWRARLTKTRGLAADLITAGHVRVNGQRADKPGRAVGAGDVLTLRLAGRVRLLRILACGERRGPTAEALAMYLDFDAPAPAGPADGTDVRSPRAGADACSRKADLRNRDGLSAPRGLD